MLSLLFLSLCDFCCWQLIPGHAGVDRAGSAACSSTLPTLFVTHTRTQNTLVPGCENTGSWPPTLRHPPQEETTPALPVALKQRSQVPRRSPVSFVLTAGRKPSLTRGHRAQGSQRECVCVCASFSVVGVCRSFAH